MVIPTKAAYEKITDADILEGREILSNSRALMLRYTTDFDCRNPTEWWYCLKDTPDNLDNMKSFRRYEINKGKKRAGVKQIDPNEYIDELYYVYLKAARKYKSYGKVQKKEQYCQTIIQLSKMRNIEFWAIFINEAKLCGYAFNYVYKDYVEYSTIKYIPEYLKDGISALLIYTMNQEYFSREGIRYIFDGERSIRHESQIQEYLEKYFDFRKAYCKLNIEYKPWMKPMVGILFPFRNILRKCNNPQIRDILAVLDQEAIARTFR